MFESILTSNEYGRTFLSFYRGEKLTLLGFKERVNLIMAKGLVSLNQ